MMLLYVKQNIFESPAQVIVNAVNTVGVMGKGIAKTYKKLYPEMYKQYRYFCEQNLLETGKLWLYKDDKKWILNFPTKEHWKNPSKIEYIESGLKKFVETYEEKGIYSISFPQIGSEMVVSTGKMKLNRYLNNTLNHYPSIFLCILLTKTVHFQNIKIFKRQENG